MNREILFRGKTRYGHWVCGSLIIDAFGNHQIIAHKLGPKGKSQITDHYEVDPSTIGQYTGLTDKNEVKIFEGDVIVYEGITSRGQDIQRQVEYNTVRCQFMAGMYEIASPSMTQCTVIGNIHDNPELTKQS